ncbi:MAG: DUF3467 domain-containing protein [Planctomycetota bacterium]|nr:DUF3467 domain-containing protein [Planctomycetota bacterium]
MAKQKDDTDETPEDETTTVGESDSVETGDGDAGDDNSDEQAASSEQAPAQQQRVAVQVDDTSAQCNYANFCRVTGSPEELIVDFALNPQPMGVPAEPIQIKQRTVMNYYTAKRLQAALQMSVQRHEAVFGVLETDISKRVNQQ